ncbi:MAG: PIG-L family deacetylase [Dermatophilaceae bacterium]
MDAVATIVFVHAHPDDEATLTSGSMARASAEGHRVVTVIATNGDHGEAPADLGPDETVVDRRRREAEASAAALGVARLAWLGYADSGMSGWDQNRHESAFHVADLDEAAGRLAALLEHERADVVVGYDWHGNYGHPDHVKVHRVVRRAVALMDGSPPRLLEATMNRDRIRSAAAEFRKQQPDVEWDVDAPMDDGNPLGMPEADIHWEVDVTAYLGQRRASLRAHASQVTDTGRWVELDDTAFAFAFGTEFYIEPGRPAGMRQGWFLAE